MFSMLEAIGFEGYAGDDVPLVFGAAAFREGDQIWNGVSWFVINEGWEKYVAKRTVTPITPQKLAMKNAP